MITYSAARSSPQPVDLWLLSPMTRGKEESWERTQGINRLFQQGLSSRSREGRRTEIQLKREAEPDHEGNYVSPQTACSLPGARGHRVRQRGLQLQLQREVRAARGQQSRGSGLHPGRQTDRRVSAGGREEGHSRLKAQEPLPGRRQGVLEDAEAWAPAWPLQGGFSLRCLAAP